MTGPGQWTVEEIAILLASCELSAEDLSAMLLNNRSPGAIAVVRQGIKLYAEGKEHHGILSRTMIEFMDKRPSLARWAAEHLP